jgi:hypothetical protein
VVISATNFIQEVGCEVKGRVSLGLACCGYIDATKPTLGITPDQLLPIYKYSTPEVVGTAGEIAVESGDTCLEAIVLPQNMDTTQGELTLQIDPSLAASMIEGLRYLEHYP